MAEKISSDLIGERVLEMEIIRECFNGILRRSFVLSTSSIIGGSIISTDSQSENSTELLRKTKRIKETKINRSSCM